MFGDNPRDPELKAAWDAFCDELKVAGELAFRDTTPVHDIDRAKGLRLLARNISLALQFQLDNVDPQHPELQRYFHPTRKQGGDNTDALYVGAPIDGSHRYRISGQRGTARFFAITVVEDGTTPWGGAVVGSLLGHEIEVDANGDFEVMLGPEVGPGNWIQTTPGAWRVTIRQFFADWEAETPMAARIDCLDGDSPAPELTVDRVCQGLADSARWVRESTAYWADMLDRWQSRPNQFLSYRQLDDNAIDATPGGEPLICYWRIPPDEALIIRVTPPEADYWAVEFGNYWWETMDYRYHLCSTNCHHAELLADGELILVASHEDPGVPNWLDPAGHGEGYVTVRWIGAESYPTPLCQQVKYTELDDHLPREIRRLTAEERQQQLDARRRGVSQRFRD